MIVLTWMWGILKSVLNGLAKFAVLCIILVAVLIGIGLFAGDGLPRTMVLELDLNRAMEDKSAPDLLNLSASPLSIMDVVLGLDRAGRDPRVKGVFLRVGGGDLSVPKAEELRDALKRFRQTGKFVIAHSQSFYSSGLGDYDLAAAADQIWMQPVSTFFAAGEGATTLFYKGLFDKLNAAPQFVQRYEYKNAANVYTETDYTPAHREATGRVLQSWYDSAVAEAAADRKLDKDTLAAAIDASPATAEEVKAKGLITDIGYDEDARQAARQKAGAGADVVGFEHYAQSARERFTGFNNAPVIAFVHAAGDIVEGGGDDGLNTSASVAGDTFAKAIREAAADRTVKAILLRVDSPGGSAIASDQILDALKKAHAAGKPIVVSMGSVAPSGGYYICARRRPHRGRAPGTLTGSIGVLWGKVAVGKSLEMAGLEGRELGAGKNALFQSSMTPWNDAQLAEVNRQADLVYADFTTKVSVGRKLPLARVQDIARGRVWTGADAKRSRPRR